MFANPKLSKAFIEGTKLVKRATSPNPSYVQIKRGHSVNTAWTRTGNFIAGAMANYDRVKDKR